MTENVIVISSIEEDEGIHARLINDEKALRRVTKKFHNYAYLASSSSAMQQPSPGVVSEKPSDVSTKPIEEAKEVFLIELASFQLALKKSVMACDAETRQVEQYNKEKERIENDLATLKMQIEELKAALEQAQTVRKRKIEYDVIAEKVNALPTREELHNSIQALENDMTAIRSENETQSRTIQAQKESLDLIISDLGTLRLMGKEADPLASPAVAIPVLDECAEAAATDISATPRNDMDVEDGLVETDLKGEPKSDAMEETVIAGVLETDDNDIEMGELAEEPKETREKGKKRLEEDREEGEASDNSSELSDVPEDD